jgi:hypothetical protein
MRTLVKQWTDKKPFTRRVRWYAAGLDAVNRLVDVKLVFEDEFGLVKRYYANAALASDHWERFRSGTPALDFRPNITL